MPSLISSPVLVLNVAYEPSQITTVKNAVKLLVKNAVEITEHKNKYLRPGIPVPSVIRLLRHVYIPHRLQVLTRKNIYLRDKYTCAYCVKRFSSSDLTLDHIQPQSRGGRGTWSNLTACCKPCNLFKANRTPEEAGMVLSKRYKPVNMHTSRHVIRAMGEDDPLWRKYLYFENTSMQQD